MKIIIFKKVVSKHYTFSLLFALLRKWHNLSTIETVNQPIMLAHTFYNQTNRWENFNKVAYIGKLEINYPRNNFFK